VTLLGRPITLPYMKYEMPKRKLALIDVTSAMQLRMRVVTKDGQCIELGVTLGRVEAQHLADALLEYSGARVKSYARGNTSTFIGTYQPDFKEKAVVHLSATKLISARRKGG
jgi:hypothetical protein